MLVIDIATFVASNMLAIGITQTRRWPSELRREVRMTAMFRKAGIVADRLAAFAGHFQQATHCQIRVSVP